MAGEGGQAEREWRIGGRGRKRGEGRDDASTLQFRAKPRTPNPEFRTPNPEPRNLDPGPYFEPLNTTSTALNRALARCEEVRREAAEAAAQDAADRQRFVMVREREITRVRACV